MTYFLFFCIIWLVGFVGAIEIAHIVKKYGYQEKAGIMIIVTIVLEGCLIVYAFDVTVAFLSETVAFFMVFSTMFMLAIGHVSGLLFVKSRRRERERAKAVNGVPRV